MEDKHLYIISGPNGAGKTTASYSVLPAHQQGYEVTLLYFWLKSPEQAIERVAERVSKGGHNICQLLRPRIINKKQCII